MKKELMAEEAKTIKKLLPPHYKCSPRENGVHCQSELGIDDDGQEWQEFMKQIRLRFKDRFMEVFHQTCARHVKFTVFLRKASSVQTQEG